MTKQAIYSYSGSILGWVVYRINGIQWVPNNFKDRQVANRILKAIKDLPE